MPKKKDAGAAETAKSPRQLGAEAFKAGQNMERHCPWENGPNRAEFIAGYSAAEAAAAKRRA